MVSFLFGQRETKKKEKKTFFLFSCFLKAQRWYLFAEFMTRFVHLEKWKLIWLLLCGFVNGDLFVTTIVVIQYPQRKANVIKWSECNALIRNPRRIQKDMWIKKASQNFLSWEGGFKEE